MYGYDTAIDRRFDRIEEVMDLAGDGNALSMLIDYAGWNANTTLTSKTRTRRTKTKWHGLPLTPITLKTSKN